MKISNTENECSNAGYLICIRWIGDCILVIKVLDMNSGGCLFIFESQLPVQSVAFSPGSAFFACCCNNFEVWNIHTSSLNAARLDYNMVYSNVALSPCGGRLVSQPYSCIVLWDLGSGQPLAHLNFDTPFSLESQIAFDIDGQTYSSIVATT
jgi:WD40 repeat protein